MAETPSDSPPEDSPERAPEAPRSKGFTANPRRDRTTRKSVVVIDKVARVLITFGGIGTILSVLGVAVFLIAVVLPLFLPAEVGTLESLDIERARLVSLGIDEYQLLGYTLEPSGRLEVFRIDTGEKIDEHQIFADGELVSSAFPLASDSAAFGTRDGSIHLASLGFSAEILDAEDLPAAMVSALEGSESPVSHEKGVLQGTAGGQYRWQRMSLEMGATAKVGNGPVLDLTHVMTGDGPVVVALVEDHPSLPEEAAPGTTDGEEVAEPLPPTSEPTSPTGEPGPSIGEPTLRLQLVRWEESTNFLTGASTFEMLDPVELPRGREDAPAYLALTGAGYELVSVWPEGHLERVNIRDPDNVFLVESGSLLPPESDDRISFFAPILGGTTFLWGTSTGQVSGGFTVRPEDAEETLAGLYGSKIDEAEAQRVFARTKSLAEVESIPVSLGTSSRSRLALTGFDDGEIRLFNITNGTQLRRFQLPEAEPVIAITMSPKENGLLIATPSRLYHADLDPRFPEAGFSAFFRPVWYEGYAQPQHIWQSSSGSDDFEMKLGLLPLIFGTLKATFYSMLFGAPLALLAAIFTSEFLQGRTRAVIKPSIELMATLPSVVLGFLAALVFAPFVEKVIPATLALLLTLPLSLLLGAYIWQLLPGSVAIRRQQWRFAFMILLIPVGIGFAGLIGPWVETWLFGGNIKGWLDWSVGSSGNGKYSSATGGWMLLCLPLSALVVAGLLGRTVNPWMRQRGAVWDRGQFALWDLVKFFGAVVATLVLALFSAWTLSSVGFDPRGSFVDTYVQRNALVVGFVMGFAIIPIIYTIAEDALSTVPEHLRSASLGAGATPWQTAVRIVIPTAMSGLFSALMIGLGRAVGETMIVLMAAGNTPVMEWNIFEGFRTLSANIAVEMPEAVKGDTHYRTLFLAALVLFLMTFVVNTIAEVIRLRFRKRAYQL